MLKFLIRMFYLSYALLILTSAAKSIDFDLSSNWSS